MHAFSLTYLWRVGTVVPFARISYMGPVIYLMVMITALHTVIITARQVVWECQFLGSILYNLRQA
jgi:hypothetical protein